MAKPEIVCDHKFVFKGANKFKEDSRNHVIYCKVEEYFCEKCLEEKVIKKESPSQYWESKKPDWFY